MHREPGVVCPTQRLQGRGASAELSRGQHTEEGEALGGRGRGQPHLPPELGRSGTPAGAMGLGPWGHVPPLGLAFLHGRAAKDTLKAS